MFPSFVYTSYIRYGVRAAPKFGKHVALFSFFYRKQHTGLPHCNAMFGSIEKDLVISETML